MVTPVEERMNDGINNEISEETGGELRFGESGILPEILKAVQEMGFDVMTPIQEKSIPILLEGRDIIGQAQTGTGKTAAFAIPMIQSVDPDIRKPQGIILCPTRELAMQAAEEIRKLTRYMHGIKVLPVYGGQDISKQIKALSQGVQIIVGTPGRVMDHLRRHTIKTACVKMIVVDEADEMLDMGFREDIETVLADMPEEHQMALFSATMPQEILDIAGTYQKNAAFIRVTPQELTVSAIKQTYYRVNKKDKTKALCRLLDYYQPSRSLIFCNTKRMVDEIALQLKEAGYEAEALHGDLSQFQRDTVMNLFRGGRCAILIATDVAARGIDVSGVDAVFNYDVPDDIEYYVHRIGRTGRAGRKGRSFTLVSGRDIYKIRSIEKVCHTTIKERKMPAPEDIVRVKSDRVLSEAMELMAQKDLTEMKEFVLHMTEKREFAVLDLAAALMKMRVGDEPEAIEEEKPFMEKSRRAKRHERERRQGGRSDVFSGAWRDRGRRGGEDHFGGESGRRDGEDRFGGERGRRSREDRFGGERGRSGREDRSAGDHGRKRREDRFSSNERESRKGKDTKGGRPLGKILSKMKS